MRFPQEGIIPTTSFDIKYDLRLKSEYEILSKINYPWMLNTDRCVNPF